MRKIYPRPSLLWKYINSFHIRKNLVEDLSYFRAKGVNYKIALRDPARNGMLYLKTLIHCLCKSLSQKNWERFERTKNKTLVGNPITVTYNGKFVCLDYLQSIFELEFISDYLNTSNVGRIMEIGAGYGRTCHVLLSNLTIQEYYIVDLDNCLRLSYNYLSQVLDEKQFSKMYFVSVDSIDSIVDHSFDLCINIDSFSEMHVDTVRYYLDYIDKHFNNLYVKNPVCNNIVKPYSKPWSWKNTLANKIYNMAGIAITRNMVLPEVMDVFDTDVIRTQAQKFVEVYRPSADWKCIADEWAALWTNYWQAVYSKG